MSECFPIMGDRHGQRRGCVPMAFMQQFEVGARLNHFQSIARLAQRGGLDPQEAMAVVQGVRYCDRRWRESEPAWANLKLIVDAEYPGWDFMES